jgi:thiamine biosynthesis protein ThiS
MKIVVNGEARTATEEMTIAALLRELEILHERVAVEVNRQILDRRNFEQQRLKDGDQVEIISFIGGGAEGKDNFVIW